MTKADLGARHVQMSRPSMWDQAMSLDVWTECEAQPGLGRKDERAAD